jgi:hypothetical protein
MRITQVEPLQSLQGLTIPSSSHATDGSRPQQTVICSLTLARFQVIPTTNQDLRSRKARGAQAVSLKQHKLSMTHVSSGPSPGFDQVFIPESTSDMQVPPRRHVDGVARYNF